jgi:hypothetical protein
LDGGSSIVETALTLLDPGGPRASYGSASRRSSCSSIGQLQYQQPVLGGGRGSMSGEELVGCPAPSLLSPRLGLYHRSSSSIGSIASPRLVSCGFGSQHGPGGTMGGSVSGSFASPRAGSVSSVGPHRGQRRGLGHKRASTPFDKLSEAIKNVNKGLD